MAYDRFTRTETITLAVEEDVRLRGDDVLKTQTPFLRVTDVICEGQDTSSHPEHKLRRYELEKELARRVFNYCNNIKRRPPEPFHPEQHNCAVFACYVNDVLPLEWSRSMFMLDTDYFLAPEYAATIAECQVAEIGSTVLFSSVEMIPYDKEVYTRHFLHAALKINEGDTPEHPGWAEVPGRNGPVAIDTLQNQWDYYTDNLSEWFGISPQMNLHILSPGDFKKATYNFAVSSLEAGSWDMYPDHYLRAK